MNPACSSKNKLKPYAIPKSALEDTGTGTGGGFHTGTGDGYIGDTGTGTGTGGGGELEPPVVLPPEIPSEPPPEDPPGPTPVIEYFGTPIETDNVVFVLDHSNSMNELLATDPGKSRLDLLKEETVKTITALPEEVWFNVVYYYYITTGCPVGYVPSHTTEPPNIWDWVAQTTGTSGLAPATQANKDSAIEWVNHWHASGWTNVEAAMRHSLAIPNADTYCLLTDGAPNIIEGHPFRTDGQGNVCNLESYYFYCMETTEQIILSNAAEKQRIFTFGMCMDQQYGTLDMSVMDAARRMLERIAQATGGTYTEKNK
jgi:hypothetical protein